MSNIAVIFRSTYGYTKKYAEWIAEELNADLFDELKVKPQTLEKYSIIVYGGGIYASGINGAKLLCDHYDLLLKKKLVVFAVGLSDDLSQEEQAKLLTHNFSLIMQNNMKFFCLRGGINYKKLSLLHRMMMSKQRKILLNKQDKTKQDELFLNTYRVNINFTEKKNIQPIIDYVNSLQILS